MTLLEDIQNSAIDGKSDLAELLRKCKLLAVRLNSKPLEDWLVWEPSGYPNEVTVPEYRVWPLEVLGYFSGPAGRSMPAAPIPLTALKFIEDDVKRMYDRYECRDSVASVEEVLRKVIGNVQVSAGHLALAIGMRLYPGFNCLQAWAEYHPSRLVELLNSVRNRILDFALAVEKEAPTAGEKEDKSASHNIEPARVNQIFNLTVYGGAANVVGSASESPITFNIGNNDFSALEQVLVEKGLTSTDIVDLKAALDSDPTPSNPQSFGPGVSSWIGKMLGKAADGSWNIGLGAAGNLLAQAIAKYYGLL